MSITKFVLGLALLVAAGSSAFASQYDGDNNPVPGAQYQARGAFDGAFASAARPAAERPAAVRGLTVLKDGDNNSIPGLR